MNILRWVAFAWGGLAASIMAYYAAQWALQPNNPLRNELGIGFGLGLMYGFPAWLGLPALAYVARRELVCVQLALLLSPLVLALAATLVLGFMGGL